MTATENPDYSSRTITAHGRRNESVRRWLESETAKQSDMRGVEDFKIRFEEGAMLLSAVASGDIEETTRLLDLGADVNYANVDGLTSLHQACIDENIEMVELLVSRNATLDACDNEGWTPLHAAASTSALDVITFLVESGANIASVNTEGEVPLDLAEEPDIQIYLATEVQKRNIDLDSARNSEHSCMLKDAFQWQSDGVITEVLDSQGATALHVASSKGYIDVVKILLDIGADVNCTDFDGWTPLHAAVFWKQQAVCELLLQNGARIYARNSFGQSPVDLAEDEMVPFMRSLARNYKSNEGFGGPEKINRSTNVGPVKLNKKTQQDLVPIIKIPKVPAEPKQPPVSETPKSPVKKTAPTQIPTPTSPTIIKPPRSPIPVSSPNNTNKISHPPGTDKTRPTVNDQAKQPDKITQLIHPPSVNNAKKNTISVSKPPSTVISKPPGISKPPSSITPVSSASISQAAILKPEMPKPPAPPATSSLPSKTPENDSSITSIPRPGISKPPTSSIQKPPTFPKPATKDEVQILEKDYNTLIQQLGTLKSELAEVIKERDTLKSKLEKAETDLINYQKLLEENARLTKENASLIKVIATFNRSTPTNDKSNAGTSA